MPSSRDDKLSAELAKSLESAMSLMQDLLGDIKDNATSLAVVKAKLESLGNSVEELSHVVRDGNGKGSMITRLALAEQSLENIEDGFDELKEELTKSVQEIKDSLDEKAEVNKSASKFKKEQALAKLKLVAVVAPGVIALAVLIIKMLLGDTVSP